MKILILGASGMIGHKMILRLNQAGHDVTGTLRHGSDTYKNTQFFNELKLPRLIDQLDVGDFDSVVTALKKVNPDVILNCIGITLRKPEIKDLAICTRINAEFPHFLKKYVQQNNKYLIHFSTDCVFTGKSELYTEDSKPDATDIYGGTKALGEVTGNNVLTLRGSQLGSEVFGKSELLEWAVSKANQTIMGYDQAIYSGVTTNSMADLVAELLKRLQRLTGLYQVSSQPISKFALLQKVNAIFQLNMTIKPDSSYKNRKVLSSDKIASEIGYRCASWDQMLEQTYQDRIKNSKLYGA